MVLNGILILAFEVAVALLLALAWLWGITLAAAGWATATAALIPFYAWYLVIEQLTMRGGTP